MNSNQVSCVCVFIFLSKGQIKTCCSIAQFTLTVMSNSADTLDQTWNRAFLTLIHNIFGSEPGIKNVPVKSDSTQLITVHARFDAIPSKGDRFQAEMQVS